MYFCTAEHSFVADAPLQDSVQLYGNKNKINVHLYECKNKICPTSDNKLIGKGHSTQLEPMVSLC